MPLFVTFDEGFTEATFRSERTQARFDGQRFARHHAPLGKQAMHLYSAEQEAMIASDVSDSDGVQTVIEGVAAGVDPIQLSEANKEIEQ